MFLSHRVDIYRKYDNVTNASHNDDDNDDYEDVIINSSSISYILTAIMSIINFGYVIVVYCLYWWYLYTTVYVMMTSWYWNDALYWRGTTVPVESLNKETTTRNCSILFVVNLNTLLNKQSSCKLFEMPWCLYCVAVISAADKNKYWNKRDIFLFLFRFRIYNK